MANAKFSAYAVAQQIKQNVRDVDAGAISWGEFSERNRAAWAQADCGELCIIGSAASRRVMAVHAALQRGQQ
jgi:hypothetical protein